VGYYGVGAKETAGILSKTTEEGAKVKIKPGENCFGTTTGSKGKGPQIQRKVTDWEERGANTVRSWPGE